MKMISISDLPDALIEDICVVSRLNPHDLLRLGATCKVIHRVVTRNNVWKQQCASRWPALLNVSPSTLTEQGSTEAIRWLEVYKSAHLIENKISELSCKLYHKRQIDHADVERMLEDVTPRRADEFISQVLFAICHSSCKASLTVKYYAEKVLRLFQQPIVADQISKLLEDGNVEKISLPTVSFSTFTPFFAGSMLFSHYFNPENKAEDALVAEFISNAVQKVKTRLKSDINVIKAINYVFYEELKIRGNSEDYYNVDNSFIHNIVKSKSGIPMTLCILYQQIASLVGLKTDIINYPRHLVLRLKVADVADDSAPNYDSIYSFIDVFQGGNTLTFTELGRREVLLKAASLQEVLLRMCHNVMTHSELHQNRTFSSIFPAVDLIVKLKPGDVWMRLRRLLLFHDSHYNLKTVLLDLDFLTENAPENLRAHIPEGIRKTCRVLLAKADEPAADLPKKLRSDAANRGVEYSIGMVMHHRRYDYTCVIRGWDNFCDMSTEWIHQMGVHRLENGPRQPFYNVLVHSDGSERYASQESLEPCENWTSVIDHDEIGRYFSKLARTDNNLVYYLPNSQLKLIYPEDEENTKELVS